MTEEELSQIALDELRKDGRRYNKTQPYAFVYGFKAGFKFSHQLNQNTMLENQENQVSQGDQSSVSSAQTVSLLQPEKSSLSKSVTVRLMTGLSLQRALVDKIQSKLNSILDKSGDVTKGDVQGASTTSTAKLDFISSLNEGINQLNINNSNLDKILNHLSEII